MSYFLSEYVSNSNLKELRKKMNPKFEDPPNLQEIFDFGNLVENVIFAPHLVNWEGKDIELAKQMAKTFNNDPICRQFLLVHDFRRQHEWYKLNRMGVKGRCKVDGDSKLLSTILEFKGLAVGTDRAFEEAVDRFDYDQAIAWYLIVTEYKRELIVAVSKTSDQLFKRLVDRDHIYYKRGLEKVKKSLKYWRDFFEPVTNEYNGTTRTI